MIRQQLYGSVAASAFTGMAEADISFPTITGSTFRNGWGFVLRNPLYTGPCYRARHIDLNTEVDVDFDADGFCTERPYGNRTAIVTMYDQWEDDNFAVSPAEAFFAQAPTVGVRCVTMLQNTSSFYNIAATGSRGWESAAQGIFGAVFSRVENADGLIARYGNTALSEMFPRFIGGDIVLAFGFSATLANSNYVTDAATMGQGVFANLLVDYSRAATVAPTAYLNSVLAATLGGTVTGDMAGEFQWSREPGGWFRGERVEMFVASSTAALPGAERDALLASMETFRRPAITPDAGTLYSATGADQTYTVPAGVPEVWIALGGAAGGNGVYSTGEASGAGGFTEIELDVVEDDVILIQVGRGGLVGGAAFTAGGDGGWPDGGGGGRGDACGGGGGGSTRVWLNGVLQAVAGGGGADAASNAWGGAGGGLVGEGATRGSGAGEGGSQVAGGRDSSDTGNANKTGLQIVSATPARTGGWGSSAGNTNTGVDDGGGGGGGYWGGGGGGGDARAGGGGSGFVRAGVTGYTAGGSERNRPWQMIVHPAFPGGDISHGTESGASAPATGNHGWAALSTDNFGR